LTGVFRAAPRGMLLYEAISTEISDRSRYLLLSVTVDTTDELWMVAQKRDCQFPGVAAKAMPAEPFGPLAGVNT